MFFKQQFKSYTEFFFLRKRTKQDIMLRNRLNGTMVSVKDSSAVACGLDSRQGQINHLKFVLDDFLLNTQHYGQRTTIGFLAVKNMCPSRVTYIQYNRYTMELVQSDTLVFRQPVQSDTFRLSLSVLNYTDSTVQSSSHRNIKCSRNNMAGKNGL